MAALIIGEVELAKIAEQRAVAAANPGKPTLRKDNPCRSIH
jgi:hypothetical protein